MRKLSLIIFLALSVPAFGQVTYLPVTVSFPHIDVGGDPAGLNYVTVIQAVNDNSATINGQISLHGDTGAALAASFDGSAPQSTFNFSLESGATRQIQVSLTGAVTAGWMQITYTPSDAQTTVLIQYRAGTNVITEVGIPSASSALASTDFPAETDTNTDTGIAIANPNTTSQAILIRLSDPNSGNQLASTTMTLAANAHIGKFLTELFPTVSGISQLRTQVSIDSCSTTACTAQGLGFLATALRINKASSTFTVLPVIQSTNGGNLVRVLPQIVVGGDPGSINFQTILYLSTVVAGGVTGTADIFDDNGALIPVMTNGSASTGHFTFTVPGNRVLRIVLSGGSTVVPGWVRLTLPASVPLIVNAVYQTYNATTLQSEASVLDSLLDTESLVYVSGTTSVGVSLVNPQPTASTISLTLYNNAGFVAESKDITLAPFGHLARFVSEFFPDFASATQFGGSLSIQAPLGFSAVAFRLTGPNIAALPVFDTILFRPTITNLQVSNPQRTTGQVSFSINVTDFLAAVVTSTSPVVNGGAGFLYSTTAICGGTPPCFDGYYNVQMDGTSMINATSGVLTGTLQGALAGSQLPSGTSATLYIYILDSLGNLSNVVGVPFKF